MEFQTTPESFLNSNGIPYDARKLPEFIDIFGAKTGCRRTRQLAFNATPPQMSREGGNALGGPSAAHFASGHSVRF
jgi:hypothetical protein